ncbi:MAG TPA: AarF/ABC1/UbiB kinase family protein [Verrucomicrobiae bacterium]|nr:AarF/ABC1/UbiB kinase family protein [Verrucomicrobiae bacterium]
MDDDTKAAKPSMGALKTRPFERNLALTKMGVSAGARIAAHEFANLFRGHASRRASDRTFYVEQAHVLADGLGRLKGSVMKVGQMLSLYGQYFLPPEAVEVLSGLQDDTPPVEWKSLEPVLKRALGRSLEELDIDRCALASASLGQVHRARRKADGAELVLKVQYPGVADAIDSDIRTLSRLIAMTRMAPKGLNLDPVYAEVKEMLHREVDYQAEIDHTQRYRQLLDGDARYVVPKVYEEYSTDQVLALSYEPGAHVRDASVQRLSQERRNALAHAALELFLRELFDWGMVQTDPHFGNYKIRLADRIVLLDFGATRLFGRGFVDGYREMLRGALLRDRALTLAGAEAIGAMFPDIPAPVRAEFAGICELIVEPFRGGVYDWGASDLPQRAGQRMARASITRHFRIPPREIVFLHRRLSGVFFLLATLRARWDARPVLERYLESKS